ncbi:hypothetical protein C8J56DRAFT_952017 [Mycena floridula]|nr:hypothetical protein C8J56DRAFT_952017 [Mycena floridula]
MSRDLGLRVIISCVAAFIVNPYVAVPCKMPSTCPKPLSSTRRRRKPKNVERTPRPDSWLDIHSLKFRLYSRSSDSSQTNLVGTCSTDLHKIQLRLRMLHSALQITHSPGFLCTHWITRRMLHRFQTIVPSLFNEVSFSMLY